MWAWLGGCGGGAAACEKAVLADLQALKDQQVVLLAEFDDVADAQPHPELVPAPSGSDDWGEGNAGFQRLKWRPKGKARAQYSSSAEYPNFRVEAFANCGDKEWALYVATQDKSPEKVWSLEEEAAEIYNESFERARAHYLATHGKDADVATLRMIQGTAVRGIADTELTVKALTP